MRINDIRILFIGGIHGVGKTLFSEQASKAVGVPRLNASTLISEQIKAPAAINKRVRNVEDNQTALIEALESHLLAAEQLLLEGHFCVFDLSGSIATVPTETFRKLSPVAVVLLLGEVELIQQRLLEREKREFSIKVLTDLQNSERKHAEDVCGTLNIPMCSVGTSEHPKGFEFVARHINHHLT